jgi:hypothetical protein
MHNEIRLELFIISIFCLKMRLAFEVLLIVGLLLRGGYTLDSVIDCQDTETSSDSNPVTTLSANTDANLESLDALPSGATSQSTLPSSVAPNE